MKADPPQQLNRSDHYNLVISVRDAMDPMRGDDQSLLLVHFGFSALGFNFEGPSIGEVLMQGRQDDLVALAQHLNIEVPGPPADPGIPTAYVVDIYSQLVAAETAFREIVRATIGPTWIDDFTADKVEGLEAKRTEEDKRRDGVSVSQDLLDYTEAFHLKSLVLKHWDKTGPILDDKKRTEVYLNAMLDVRNTIAHARPVVPHERQLLAGIAGQIQNLISVYRSGSETADAYYASINYARDSFGVEGRRDGVGSGDRKRLKIGQVIEFDFSATDPHDREIEWTFSIYDNGRSRSGHLGIALGPSATFLWTVGEEEVGEQIDLWVSIANESPYQRNGTCDDRVCFGYSVSPPVPPRSR
ncbi:hypothetical protein FZI91_11490 [Mycobacterium sp. CBMA271]|uniref:hypothetical protein n=1 Tax=unclassified Mycobacteroides TaxID=2618759 RepID=UPI0012DDB3F9|nr:MULTISPECIES: hypothetical protein [unclassified Mycobacteroides]MUM16178.1 hypothetical protein [Mycobacteroides sp. CBMA 326]MUM22319.1 hypothetical protein [Mycobacteroides sp. CBMA 271]